MSVEPDKLIEWFRSSAAYINAHRGKTFVVMLGGEALQDGNLANVIYDLSLLHSLGIRLVLVHGARPQISAALQAKGLDSHYHRNLRVTSGEALQSVMEAVGALGTRIEALFSTGTSKSPMHGAEIQVCRGNFVTARPVGVLDGIDFHSTGRVRKVRKEAICQQLDDGHIVLLSNLGYSITGDVYNLRAEEVAAETAIQLNADKLVLFVPGEGVYDDAGQLLASLSATGAGQEVSRLAESDSIDDRVTAEALSAAIQANQQGVHRAHLISYSNNGALLKELFTREGKGSLVSSDSFHLVRQAQLSDVPAIISLIKPLEEDGTLVQRSRELLENEIQNFTIIDLEDSLIACAALYQIDESHAEIACIAIHPDYRRNGYGEQLLQVLQDKALALGCTNLVVLTTVTSDWFQEHGFEEAEPGALPDSRQQLYNLQRNSKVLIKPVE